MIIQEAIKEASLKLKDQNIKSFILDSEILMSKVLNKKREYIILNIQEKLKQRDYSYYTQLVNERANGKPIAYLIEKKFFWKDEFFVNKDVLIPRPDTEVIVEEILKITKNKYYLNLLDIGVGSGCILLSVLKEKKGFIGTGIDLSSKCLNLCKKNIHNLKVRNRIRLFKSDVDNFNYGKYDLIISNPPYIKKYDLKYLEKNVVDYEPILALDGGLDGTSEIRKVINKSSELIKKNGKLILEISFDQKLKVISLLKKKGFYINKVLKDFAKNDRCIVSTKID
tara:strand:- start:1998 stop:2843 length:846 start_codon:yes stop_codon:yes gene_type:complete